MTATATATATIPPPVSVDVNELAMLCATDHRLFCQTFFPDAFTQAHAPFHEEMWALIENPNIERLAIEAFRGAAKTTNIRIAIAKRIAYGISNFILLVSETSTHSISSLAWLKRYIEGTTEAGTTFSATFGLEKGDKWAEDHIEVINRSSNKVVSIRAVGVTGQLRGLNLGNKRPDFIFLDDPCNDENSGTEDARHKLRDVIYGALFKSLAPRTECPEAKIVLAQTPIAMGDLIWEAERDESWVFRRYSCYVVAPDGTEVSAWPSRFPTATLKRDEASYRKKNMLSVFSCEMRCVLITDEETSFLPEWLKIYDALPEWALSTTRIGAVDPTPPPSAAQQARGMGSKDFETLGCVGFSGRKVILLDFRTSKGHGPDWTMTNFFEVQDRWKCQVWRVEGVSYQQTLCWLLEGEMKQRKRWVQIDAAADNRKKSIRIRQAFTMICGEGELWVRRDMLPFIEQWNAYPAVKHDDALDMVAMAVQKGINMGLFGSPAQEYSAADDQDFLKALESFWCAP